MKRILSNILVLLIYTLLASCHERKVVGNLGEMESYFEEPLTSISSEGDSAFWIGSENGDIWYLKQHSSKEYTIEGERIYKVVTDTVLPDGKICWIGMHNSGLQKWNLAENHTLLSEKYAIPNKGYNYSVYDILLTEHKIYVATSQGLYVKSRNGNENLKLVYPLETGIGKPFIVNNICLYRKQYLLCSTQEGVLCVDLLSNKTNVYHSGEQISSLSVYNGEICVLTPGHFYIEDINGNVIQEIKLTSSPRLYYRAGNVHYFFSETHLLLSDDLSFFLDIPLRRKVPQFCNNVVAADLQNGLTFLITDHALWNIPLHLSVFNANGEIVAACSDENNIYYLNNDGELYKQSIGESVASKIFEFPANEVVSGLMSDENYIYYISNQHLLKKIKVNRSYVGNIFFSSPEILYQSPTKITAFCLRPESYGSSIYLGIQDELVYIDEYGKSVLIEALHNHYITSFYYLPHTDKLYISTLNDGVYYGSRNNFQIIEGSEKDKFIRDIFVTDGHSPFLMILTNHYLRCKESNDSIVLKGYNKLLKVNDSLFYVLPEFGLEKYVVNHGRIEKRGDYFQDICFNPKASFVLNDTLYLGSGIGVMKQNALSVGSVSWIGMDSSVPNLKTLLVVISFIFMFLLIVFGGFFIRKNSKRRFLKMQIDELQNRLIELEKNAYFVNGGKSCEVEKLKKIFQHISQKTPDFLEVKSLSEKIMKLNQDIAFRLSKKIEKQNLDIVRYGTVEGRKLVNASQDALISNNLELIILRVQENNDWLYQMDCLQKRIKDFEEKIEGTLSLEGVNEKLCQDIENFKNLIKDRTLSEMLDYVEKINAEFKKLYSDDVLRKIEFWIVEKVKKLKEQESQQKINRLFQYVISGLENIYGTVKDLDRIDLLKKLALIDSVIQPIQIKCRIAELVESYIEKNETIKDKKGTRQDGNNDVIKEEIEVIKKKANAAIVEFYEKISTQDRTFLIQILQSRKLESSTAKALVVLISIPNVKRSYVASLLGKEDKSVSPVISHCFFKLRKEKKSLEEYVKENHYSMINDILQLIEKEES